MDQAGLSVSTIRMLCKVLLLILFSLAETRSRPQGRLENLVENLPGRFPRVMPWPVPWYIQGVILHGRPDEMQEKTEETDIMSEEREKLDKEIQEEKVDKFVVIQTSPELNKWTRIQKRSKKTEPRDSRIRILKRGDYQSNNNARLTRVCHALNCTMMFDEQLEISSLA